MDGGHCVPVKFGYRLPAENRVGFEVRGYRIAPSPWASTRCSNSRRHWGALPPTHWKASYFF